MATDAEILKQVKQVFQACARPAHFTNYTHCEECAEHDKVLSLRTVDSLRREDAGTIGWDPFCFTAPDGFKYYFPALVRLSLENPPKDEWYGHQLLFHLTSGGRKNRFYVGFDNRQRRAVVEFLKHLGETRRQLLEHNLCDDTHLEALKIWSGGE